MSDVLHIAFAQMSLCIPSFIHQLSILPESAQVPLEIDRILAPALQFETFQRHHLDHNNPYAGLIDVFDTPNHCRKLRLRPLTDRQDPDSQCYLFPLQPGDFPHLGGQSSCVEDLKTFRDHFNLFTHNILRDFRDWSNVIVAGGSVLAALTSPNLTEHELIRLYHTVPYQSADIDIFVWGLSPSDAERKLIAILGCVKASVPWDVIVVRKANVISIHTQYPHRPLQIILRLYQSPTEVLIGFDVCCSSVCFDGEKVWATPRAMASIIMRRNVVDMSRRSPSYEVRLAKYAQRGFEVYLPCLQRQNVNHYWFENDLPELPQGLSRLLVLEYHLAHPNHYTFIKFPIQPLKSLAHSIGPFSEDDTVVDYSSRYERVAFQIPYGVGWDASSIKEFTLRVENCLRQTLCNNRFDHSEDCTGQHLHRHIMKAYDTMEECLADDVCETCPRPRTVEEVRKQQAYDSKYIRGALRYMSAYVSKTVIADFDAPVSFIQENPGQQRVSGSFNPTNDAEWEIGAYYFGI